MRVAASTSVWTLALALLICVDGASMAFGQGWAGGPRLTRDAGKAVARTHPKPTQPLPTPDSSRLRVEFADEDVVMSESQILHRIGRIYGYQAELLMAEADGDEEKARNLLELAMTELGTLLQADGVADRSRFQEMYRTVLTEYERYYGASDSLTFQHGDIFQARADMFTAMNDIETPLLEDVQMRDLRPIETAVPMTMNRLVEQSIAYLLRSPDKHLYRWLSRSETYFPMVEQILAEEGVPDELKYLAMIESGLNPTARSWAAAGGMWQFITATGRAYGLQVNGWVDERMDPEKATRAAARHLRDLYAMFDQDWHLALAGYNCSPGRIRRELARAEARLGRKATFWDIYNNIPRETRNYVPMFIATALVASNPDAFDLRPVEPGPRYEYDHVPVPGMLSLSKVADLAGTSEATIKALNPELRRGSTPPAKGAYYIRVPLGASDGFMQGLASLPPSQVKSAVEYVVKRGDALGRIASRNGVTLRELMDANNLRNSVIHPGQTLIIPVPAYDGPATIQLTDAEPSTVRYGQRMVRPIAVDATNRPAAARPTPVSQASARPAADRAPAPRQTAAPSEPARSQTRVVYTVRRGDSLTKIGQKYGVTVAQLRQWNNLSSTTIHAGQRLYLYEGATSASAPASPTIHRVQSGDTLGKIASKYGVTVADLQRWNKLRTTKILRGQRLVVNAAASAETQVTHLVRRGESLGKIAQQYGVSVRQIKSWNDLNSNTIHPGQQLRIRT